MFFPLFFAVNVEYLVVMEGELFEQRILLHKMK